MSPSRTTLTTFHAKSSPAANSIAAHRAWSKQYLAFFQELATQAPSAATSTLMNDLVLYIKAGANDLRHGPGCVPGGSPRLVDRGVEGVHLGHYGVRDEPLLIQP